MGRMAAFEDSYYEASAVRPPPAAALAGETAADVCVVGGGITGISCALRLAETGRRVVVLESRQVGWGASGRSGGQIIYGFSKSNLTAPAKQAGVSPAYLFNLAREACELVKERIAQYEIACDWQPGYATAATKPAHYRALQKEAEQLVGEFGYESVAAVPMHRFREIVTSRRYYGALTDSAGGHLHPLKYVLGLAAAAVAAGAALHENTEVVDVRDDGAQKTVHTADGGTVRCAQVVIACNAYNRFGTTLNRRLGNLRGRVMPVGTYIAATEPLGDTAKTLITDGRCVCDSNFVLDYFRISADTRLLFGGRVSYSTFQPSNLRALLQRRMVWVFPQLAEAKFAYVWGGFVAITQNRFPDIGRCGDGIYYAQGYSGHGMAMSGFAGKTIADAMIGDSERLDVFHRITHRNFPGGERLRMPLLVLAMLYYRLRDLL